MFSRCNKKHIYWFKKSFLELCTVKHLISVASEFDCLMGKACLCILILPHSYFHMNASIYTFIENLILGEFIYLFFFFFSRLSLVLK